MKTKIYPGFASGEIRVPSSKSVVHRLLICACLCNTNLTINDVDINDDILATVSCLRNLKAKINIENNKIEICKGIDIDNILDEVIMDANFSASTLRFLIPLSSKLSKKVIFKGRESLIARPNDIYKSLYEKENKIFDIKNNEICIEGALESHEFVIDGSISSQFISGLLFYLPLVRIDSVIKVTNEFSSKPYVLLTISILKEFGIDINITNNLIYIKGGQSYKASNKEIYAEGDYSQAAYFFCLGAIDGKIYINNLKHDSLQGDKKIITLLEQVNAFVKTTADGYYLEKQNLKLIDNEFDLLDTPDLAPILLVLLSMVSGSSIVKNVRRLKFKESNRILAMKEELEKLDIDIECSLDENEIKLLGKKEIILNKDIEVSSHNDHRIFMALAILGVSIKGTGKLIIDGTECITKSYPKFLDDLHKLNILTEKVND